MVETLLLFRKDSRRHRLFFGPRGGSLKSLLKRPARDYNVGTAQNGGFPEEKLPEVSSGKCWLENQIPVVCCTPGEKEC